MKRWTLFLLAGVSIVTMLLGLGIVLRKTKRAGAVTVISGADGPTSIFLAGKLK